MAIIKIKQSDSDEGHHLYIDNEYIGLYNSEQAAREAGEQLLYDFSHPPIWSWSARAYLPQHHTRQAEVHRNIASLIYQLENLEPEPDLRNESELEWVLEELKAIDADNGRRIFDSAPNPPS